MPVDTLFVEGGLDAQLLTAILGGSPFVRRGGSKNSLAPRARTERCDRGIAAAYLRDRDFDFDPPDDCTRPAVDRLHGGEPLGWHWCRHEIESYLIDPVLVAQATGWDRSAYEDEVTGAARRIRHYQIARWVVGTARRSLPPHHDLNTKPVVCHDHDFRLPADMGEAAMRDWARDHIASHHRRIAEALGCDAVDAELARRREALTESAVASPAGALLWCSGKDILAALEPWTAGHGLAGARAVLNCLRDWVIEHPEDAVAALPEWQALRDILRA
jgi:hypothetical protein